MRVRAGKDTTTTTLDYSDYPYQTSVLLRGTTSIGGDYGSYCYHQHLYNFMYTNVVLGDDSTDSSLDFVVTGHMMSGFPGATTCNWADWASIEKSLKEDTNYATSADEFAWTCGYYVEYEWNGEGDVYFEIDSNNALVKTMSAIAMAALATLFL